LVEETITIRFRVDTSELERAVTLLKQLLGPLQQFQTRAREFSLASGQMGASLERSFANVDEFRGRIKRFGEDLGLTGKNLSQFIDVMEILSTTEVGPEVRREAIRALRDMTGLRIKDLMKSLTDLRKEFGSLQRVDILANLPSQVQLGSSYVNMFASDVRKVGETFGLTGDKLNAFVDDILYLASVRLPKPEFDLYVQKIASSAKVGEDRIREYVNFLRSEMGKMPGIMRRQEAEARRLARAYDPVLQQYQRVRRQMRAMIGAMGGTLYQIRRLSYQIYWWGIGMMFVSMSYARLEQRMVTHQSRMLSLARAYSSVIEAERDLNETMLEYGRSSEEYREAAGRLLEARMALRLSIEQTRMAILQENMAWIQLVFGIFPVLINSFILGTQLYAMMYSRKIMDVTATSLLTGTTQGLTSAQIQATASAWGNTMALEAMGNAALGAGIKMNIGKALALGFATAGLSLAISMAMIAWATAQADAEIAKLQDEMKDLGEAFSGNIEMIEKFKGGSPGLLGIAEASREAKSELRDLYNLMKLNIRPLEVETILKMSEGEEIEEEKYQYIIRKYVDKEEEIQSGIQIVHREFLGEPPPIESMIQNIIRNYIEEEPPIRSREQIINRRFTGEEPPIMEKMQIINRVFRGIETIESPVVQKVSRILIQDIPEVSSVTQEVRRRLVEDIPSIRDLNENIIGRGNNTYFVNITFPSLTIREEADIVKIGEMIDSIFQKEYYAGGGD